MKIACPNCGANIVFDVKKQKCYCEHCSAYTEVEKFKLDVNESIYYNEHTCTSCGANLITTESDIITSCAYCGSNEIISERLQGEYKPEAILPFYVSKENILEYYIKFAKRNNFSKELVNATLNDVKGIYVPYYAFSWRIKIFLHQKDNYILYSNYKDAGKQFDDLIMENIQPFDMDNFVPFNPGYLAGFYADTLNDDQNEIYEKSKQTLVENFKEPNFFLKQLRKINFQNYYAKNLSIANNFNNTIEAYFNKKTLFLLPVYFFCAKTNNETYLFSMNGRTGRMSYKILEKKYSEVLYEGEKVDINNQYTNVRLNYVEEENNKLCDGDNKDCVIITNDRILEKEYSEVLYKGEKADINNRYNITNDNVLEKKIKIYNEEKYYAQNNKEMKFYYNYFLEVVKAVFIGIISFIICFITLGILCELGWIDS